MGFKKTEVHILQRKSNMRSLARTGISLHCHTTDSKEMLDFVPHYAERLPIISHFWKRESEKYKGKNGVPIAFDTAYWAPPFSFNDVISSEKKQIEDIGLASVVSVTDHDSIDGAAACCMTSTDETPISMEWTVPFDFGFFHIGVHGMPEERSKELTELLLSYTFPNGAETPPNLSDILATLNSIEQILVVLNHPLWDIELAGDERHRILLGDFLKKHSKDLHALEINGFRSWSENKEVLELAEAYDLPVVSGGDRHACQPNTIINVTNAVSFPEFAAEVRMDRRSEVVIMPEYQLPLHSRQLQAFSEILAFYPDFPTERSRWFDRVFFDINDGRGTVPLSSHGWERGGPTWLRAAIWTLGFLGSRSMRPFFDLLVNEEDKVRRDIQKAISVRPDLGLSPKLSSRTA